MAVLSGIYKTSNQQGFDFLNEELVGQQENYQSGFLTLLTGRLDGIIFHLLLEVFSRNGTREDLKHKDHISL